MYVTALLNRLWFGYTFNGVLCPCFDSH